MASVVQTPLAASHAGVEYPVSMPRAVITSKDKNRVLINTFFREELAQPADVLVDIRNHSIELRDTARCAELCGVFRLIWASAYGTGGARSNILTQRGLTPVTRKVDVL